MPPPKANTDFVPIISTRNNNKLKRPGRVVDDAKQKRRTPAEVRREREEEASRREAQEQRESQNLATVASIEDRLHAEDVQRRSSNRQVIQQPAFVPSPDEMAEVVEPREVNDPVSSGSSDEYEPSKDDDGESEVSCSSGEEEVEVDSGKMASSKGKKKKKPGRDDINVHRKTKNLPYTSLASTPQSVESNSTGTKRSASAVRTTEGGTGNKKPKRDARHTTSSLTADWESKPSVFKPRPTAPSSSKEDINDATNDSMVREGGGFIPDGETDDVESKSMVQMTKNSKKKFISMPIKISDTRSAGERMTKKAQRGGKDKWTLDHLPPGTTDVFTDTLIPIARLKAGTQDPWIGLSVAQVQSMVGLIFEGESYKVNNGDAWTDLVAYHLSNWCTKFASKAADAVQALVRANTSILDDGAKDKVRDLVDFYLTKRGTPPLAPFLFKVWEEDGNTGKLKRKGRFQSDLVIYTLAHAHFIEYDPIPDPDELDEDSLPCGALVMAVQAVEHALKFWVTGEYVPDGRAKFCAEDYGDRIVRKKNATGKLVDVKILGSGLYLPAAKALPRSQWREIFEEVGEVLESSNRRKKGRSMSMSSRASSEVPMEVESTPLIILSDDDE
ncbi:hypothetical protein CPC08DRAFT_767856 [Agrocybe pediades]|nr:hypothetical protein CPC08DRAFT_767856 [Agrocybe pediades]